MSATAESAGSYSVSSHDGIITVVIPAYNESGTVERCLRETHQTLDELGCRFEILLVDDGSSDDTLVRAKEVAAELPFTRILGAPENQGKGATLRYGARAALGDLVLFMDADMEVHPRQLSILYAAMNGAHADVAIGSKMHPRSTIDYALKRRVLSRGYYLLVRSLFRLPVRDTQTGLKLFRKVVLRRVGPRIVVKRFAFDLEVLVNVNRLGYRIVEAPVIVTRERDFPRVGVGSAVEVLWDTAAIWYRTYVLRYYDRIGPSIDRVVEEAAAFEEPARNRADIA